MTTSPIRTLAELRADGVSDATIQSRVRRGAWLRLLPQVYATTPEVDTLLRCRAVTRWQPAAVLSHGTAGWVWGLAPEPAVVAVTVPRRLRVRAPDWVRVHRRELPAGWVTSSRGMAVLTAERALVDVLGDLAPPAALRLLDVAPAAGVNLTTARRVTAQGVRLRGAPAARAALAGATPGAVSEPERVLARALVRRGVRLRCNAPVGRYRCDFVDHVTRTVVEVDGRAFHSAPEVFARDRRRQNELQLAGWLVLRYAASDVLADPDGIAAEIAEVLVQRARAGRVVR